MRFRQVPFWVFKEGRHYVCFCEFGATQGRSWKEAKYMMRDFLLCALDGETPKSKEVEVPKAASARKLYVGVFVGPTYSGFRATRVRA